MTDPQTPLPDLPEGIARLMAKVAEWRVRARVAYRSGAADEAVTANEFADELDALLPSLAQERERLEASIGELLQSVSARTSERNQARDAVTVMEQALTAETQRRQEAEAQHTILVGKLSMQLDAERTARQQAEQLAHAWRTAAKDERRAATVQLTTAEQSRAALRTALETQTERACRFNCDAESSCNCPAHQTLRAALLAAQATQTTRTDATPPDRD